MKTLNHAAGVLAITALSFLAGGCTTSEMKGTPFYSGEYDRRNGPAEQRVNVWPLFYYREPALSVLWPVFEFTDDHTAVRPLFSVYGLDRDRRDYSLLWPFMEFDFQSRENRVFPVFWGDNYHVVFPVYWHFGQPWGTAGGTDSLFPLWLVERTGTNVLDVWSPWPVARFWHDRAQQIQGSMVLPLYWHERDRTGSRFFSLPWMSGSDLNGGNWRLLTPIFYENANKDGSILVTPFWAQGHADSNYWRALIPFAYWDPPEHTLLSPLWAHWRTENQDTELVPWLFSWETRRAERNDLWLAGGLAHSSWGRHPGPSHVFPIYYRDAAEHTLLTPLFGRDGPGEFYYPLTPLAGVRTGGHAGSWLFPLYSHSRTVGTNDVDDTFLMLGGHSRSARENQTWLIPLFSYHDFGPLDSVPEAGREYGHYGKSFWCLPFCWYKDECTVHPASLMARPPAIPEASSLSLPDPATGTAGTNRPLLHTFTRKYGVFPLWSCSTQATPEEGRSEVNRSLLLLLYDFKHELTPNPAGKPATTNDYTRARVLWRLWHYERLNGNVSVDVFPGFTYDQKTDGYGKTSLFWRLFRYERSPAGTAKLDVLFVPLIR